MKEYQFSRPPDGDRSQGWAILSVCWAFVLAALATTVLRVWVRVRLTRNLRWDDHNIIIAMVRLHGQTLTKLPALTNPRSRP